MYVVIVGAGKVGWNLARELINKRHEVTVIEADQHRYAVVEQELEHSAMYGDGSELWVLERSGIERADLVVAVTGDDEDNILISQVAREKYGVERVVARCNNPRNLQHFELLGVRPVISATDLILRLIEHEVPKYGLVHLLDLPEERLEIIELEVAEGSPAAGRAVKDLGLPDGSLVISILREGGGFVPDRRLGDRAERRGPGRARRGYRVARDRAVHRPHRGLAVARRKVDHLIIGGGLAAGELRALAARGGRGGVDPAGGPRAGPALQPAAAVEGLPPGEGVARGRAVSPGRVVGRAEHRAAPADERDEAGHRRAGRHAVHEGRDRVRHRPARHGLQREAPAGGRLRPRRDPLPARLRQLGCDQGRRGRPASAPS